MVLVRQILKCSQILGKIKAYHKSDWRSFENIANYHGLPNMCDLDWNNAYVPQRDSVLGSCNYDKCYGYGCCIHGYCSLS